MTNRFANIHSTRPTTFATTARIDIRSLATLARFWIENQREPIRGSAELLRISLETLRDIIVENHPDLAVTHTQDAIEIMKGYGLSDPVAVGKRNRASLIKQLQAESLEFEGIDPAYTAKTRAKHDPTVDKAFTDRIAAQLDGKETIDDAQARRDKELEEMRDRLGISPEEVIEDEDV